MCAPRPLGGHAGPPLRADPARFSAGALGFAGGGAPTRTAGLPLRRSSLRAWGVNSGLLLGDRLTAVALHRSVARGGGQGGAGDQGGRGATGAAADAVSAWTAQPASRTVPSPWLIPHGASWCRAMARAMRQSGSTTTWPRPSTSIGHDPGEAHPCFPSPGGDRRLLRPVRRRGCAPLLEGAGLAPGFGQVAGEGVVTRFLRNAVALPGETPVGVVGVGRDDRHVAIEELVELEALSSGPAGGGAGALAPWCSYL